MKTCHSKRLEIKKILFSQIQPLPNAQFLQVTPQLTIYPLQTTQALLLVIKSPALHSTTHQGNPNLTPTLPYDDHSDHTAATYNLDIT